MVFKCSVLKVANPFSKYVPIAKDGNCGFGAVGHFFNKNGMDIRKDFLDFLIMNEIILRKNSRFLFDEVFDLLNVPDEEMKIFNEGGSLQRNRWFLVPECLFLTAFIYKRNTVLYGHPGKNQIYGVCTPKFVECKLPISLFWESPNHFDAVENFNINCFHLNNLLEKEYQYFESFFKI